MATYNVQRGKHATTVGGVVDHINFARTNGVLRVANRSSSVAVYFTWDGTDPTVAGDDTYYVAPGTSIIIEDRVPFVMCELISTAAADYSAEVY